MSKYDDHEVIDKKSLEHLIAQIMIEDGPDGHCDGCDIIVDEIWKRFTLQEKKN